MTDAARDTGYAADRWAFDDEVTRVFDDMLERSIPQYRTMRSLVHAVGRKFVHSHSTVVDLGCSRGEALAPFAGHVRRLVGLEVSEPMLQAAAARFGDRPDVELMHADLRHGVGLEGEGWEATLVLSVLTLMFVPVEYRPGLLAEVYELLRPVGALILVEKVLGSSGRVHRLLTDLYYDGKRQAGYDQDAIDRKRLALEGVLVPLTASANEELLAGAGFREVECFWRCGPFVAWVAVK